MDRTLEEDDIAASTKKRESLLAFLLVCTAQDQI